jgi:Flp pilus assembly protein TadD
MKFLRHPGLVCGLVFLLSGCASYTDDIKVVQTSFRAGQYGDALQKLEESPLKEQTRNRLLYLLEKAMILDRQGQRDDSRKLLLKAARIMKRWLFTRCWPIPLSRMVI